LIILAALPDKRLPSRPKRIEINGYIGRFIFSSPNDLLDNIEKE